MEIREIDFDYLCLLRELQVRVLFEKLTACIERVRSRRGPRARATRSSAQMAC